VTTYHKERLLDRAAMLAMDGLRTERRDKPR
jgi:hypothetical protein